MSVTATAAASGLTVAQATALHVGPGNGLPHDPLALVLYARACEDPAAGFSADRLDDVVVDPCCRSLILGPAPGTERALTEASGSFGGLKPPTGVAVAGDGTVFLIDHTRGLLKYFDSCDCAFKLVPCFSAPRAMQPGAGGTPPTVVGAPATALPTAPAQAPAPHAFVPLTRLASPMGLAVSGASLLVTDSGNHRVVVVGLIGLVPRGALRLAASTGLRNLWKPYGVAADSHHNVYVSDPDHARIDVFGPNGRWQKAWEGLGAVTHLAMDCNDKLLAVIADHSLDAQGNLVAAAVEIDDGTVKVLTGGPAAVRDRLPRPPMFVDRAGRMNLSGFCSSGAAAVFDPDGYPVPPEKKIAVPIFAATGTYRSVPLDSRRLGCVWHRVILTGDIPVRAGITIRTMTSDIELDANELAGLDASSWTESQTIRDTVRGVADALILSPPGRYLWLQLVLSGDTTVTPTISRLVIEFPRVSLRRFLPGVYGMDPAAADFTDRFTSLFDTTLRSIENRIDTLPELFNPRSAPAQRLGLPATAPDFLSWVATWIGVPLPRQWPEAVRRAMLRAATCLYTIRGTRTGLRELLLTFLGFRGRQCADSCPVMRCEPLPLNCAPAPAPCAAADPPLILELYRLRRWLFVGAGKLGDDSVLWGRRIVNRSQLSGSTRTGNARLGPLSCPPDRQPATRFYSVPDPLRDPFFEYAHKFTVFVPARVKARDWQRRGLEQILALEAPAHTQWNIEYVEPRFRVGVQALIGLDSVIARVPDGIRLPDGDRVRGTPLGHGSVLPPHPGRRTRIGIGTRVGETARLA